MTDRRLSLPPSPRRRAVPRSWIGLALLVAAAGCDDQSLTPEPMPMPMPTPAGMLRSRAGSRLKVPLWTTADGFRQEQGRVFDSARGEDCTFIVAADGRRRCLPVASTPSDPADVFADGACTQPLATTWEREPRYGRFLLASVRCGDDQRSEYRELGESFEGDLIYRRSDAGCVSTNRSRRTGYRYAGPALAPELFVAADEIIAPPAASRAGAGGGRLALLSLHAEDGAVFEQGLFDREAGVPCEPRLAEDGSKRCLPRARYVAGPSGPFEGLGCSGPALASLQLCPADRVDVVAKLSADCPRRTSLHAPGARWSGERSLRWSEDMCQPAAPASTPALVQVGAELEPAGFAALQLDRTGTERLRRSVYTDGTGAAVPEAEGWAYDAWLGAPCAFTVGADGRARCLPSLLPTLFGDAACTQAVAALVLRPDDPCQPEPTDGYLMVGATLHHQGEKLDVPPAPMFARGFGGSCGDASYLTVADYPFLFFAVGAAADIEPAVATGSM